MKRPTFTRRAFTLSLTVAAALASSTALYSGRAMAQDELVVVFAEDSNSDALYDPRVSQSRHEKQLFLQVFDTLIAADYDGSLHPGLAESWELSDDATELKMTLKQGVTFHDGTPFDAEAVKFTFDTVVDPATGSQSAVDFLGPYDSTEILGPHELIIHFSQPFPSAETALTNYFLAIVSPTAVQEMGNGAFAQAPWAPAPSSSKAGIRARRSRWCAMTITTGRPVSMKRTAPAPCRRSCTGSFPTRPPAWRRWKRAKCR